jgi:hypothetical protein
MLPPSLELVNRVRPDLSFTPNRRSAIRRLTCSAQELPEDLNRGGFRHVGEIAEDIFCLAWIHAATCNKMRFSIFVLVSNPEREDK